VVLQLPRRKLNCGGRRPGNNYFRQNSSMDIKDSGSPTEGERFGVVMSTLKDDARSDLPV
jgi:hypothetical protein